MTEQQTPHKSTLEGAVPPLASQAERNAAMDQAFDYRGDITLTLKDGRIIEGYLFDRSTGPSLEQSVVRLFPKDRDEKLSVRYSEITRLEFSGRDTAAGKGFQTWITKYFERKAAGEHNISLEPEKLD